MSKYYVSTIGSGPDISRLKSSAVVAGVTELNNVSLMTCSIDTLPSVSVALALHALVASYPNYCGGKDLILDRDGNFFSKHVSATSF